MQKVNCTVCTPERMGIKFVSEDNLFYFAELIKKCEDARVEAQVKKAIAEANVSKTNIIDAINDMLSDGTLMPAEDVTKAIGVAKTEAINDAVAKVKNSLGADIDKAVATKVPEAVNKYIEGKKIVASDDPNAPFVRKEGDVMSGNLTAPAFITGSGIKFY